MAVAAGYIASPGRRSRPVRRVARSFQAARLRRTCSVGSSMGTGCRPNAGTASPFPDRLRSDTCVPNKRRQRARVGEQALRPPSCSRPSAHPGECGRRPGRWRLAPVGTGSPASRSELRRGVVMFGPSVAAPRVMPRTARGQEYLEQVGHVVAAAAVESGTFQSGQLDGVARRDDALGQLARVVQRMATEVWARERRLKQEVRKLRIDRRGEGRPAGGRHHRDRVLHGLQRKASKLRLDPGS